ncbi:MAG: bifunctional riboflavin kinase/FMN adenylyltransferase [Pirellulaceae bacterium]|nr:bifunctional riboflavin kinase/FMN adenylyltransferase [Pirellulaceae bacterium]
MKILTAADQFSVFEDGSVLSIGNYDGIHCGHGQIIKHLCQMGASHGVPSALFTLDPHPVSLLYPEREPPKLCTVEEKASYLADLGVDYLIAYPIDQSFLELTAIEFFKEFVVNKLHVKAMVEGPNFYFGKNREGDIKSLHEYCKKDHIQLRIEQPAQAGGEIISSTRIRTLLSSGEIDLANELLGRWYSITGVVKSGAGRGRMLGFPTANLEQIPTLIPAAGVYSGLVSFDKKREGGVSLSRQNLEKKELFQEVSFQASLFQDGKMRRPKADKIYLPAAIHIGKNPTFAEERLKVEVHVLDFQGDLYEEELTLYFLQKVREVTEFSGEESLVAQLEKDVQSTRDLVEAL